MMALESQLNQLRVQLQDVALRRQVHALTLTPLLHSVAQRDHDDTWTAQQRTVDARADRLQEQQQQWNSADGPAARAAVDAAAVELGAAVQQRQQLDDARAALQQETAQLSAIESLHGSRSARPAPASLAALSLPLLQHLLRFLTKADLAHAAATCFAWQRRLDCGALWSLLCLRAVAAMVRVQRAEAAAADAKRRALVGLEQNFASSNFLATLADRHAPTPATPHGNGNVTTTSGIGLGDDPIHTALQLHSQIQVTIPPSAASSASKKSGGTVTLSKADMFSAALAQLQQQVDPALSDFEDESQKLASHQAIVAFLQSQRAAHMHNLGVARIALGEEQHRLDSTSREKDALARRIQALERQIAAEKAAQQSAAAAAAAARRTQTQAANLRRNMDALVEQSLGADAGPDEDAAAASIEAQHVADGIALLRQQKKVLIKAVKSMHAELDQTKKEKEEYTAKLQEIKQKLQALNL